MSSSTTTKPKPRREEDRVTYAGIAPKGWDATIPRQSQESTEPLLDPPVPVPDPYGWMRDDERTNPEILEHLALENAYTEGVTSHLKPLQEELYGEFLGSIQETDYTVPRPRGEYWYYTRTFEGKSYSQYCRAPKTADGTYAVEWDGTKDAPILAGEEAYLDVNVLAVGKSYCSVTSVKPSPCHKYVAFSVDYKGDETYTPHIKNMETGEVVALKDATKTGDGDSLLETNGSFIWGKDVSTIFYLTKDPNDRPYRLYQRSNWQDDIPIDTLLKEELDDLYYANGYKSQDGKYLFFETASIETSEVWFLKLHDEEDNDTDNAQSKMQCIAPRRNKVLYEAEHRHNQWWIWTNVGSTPNMQLMSSPPQADCATLWKPILNADDKPIFDGSLEKSIDAVTVFNTYVAIEGRQGGIPRVWIYHPESRKMDRVEFAEKAHDVGLAANYGFDVETVAVTYDSLVTPPQTMELALSSPNDGERVVLKAKSVPGYQKELYACDRRHVLSRDGTTQIPISLVYRKDAMEKVQSGEQVPVHLYGYGSYGMCCESDYSVTRLPLLDRGIIYVIAHIRGGGEMGRQWYEEPNGAKFLCKKNTFFDFVDVAEHLVQKGTTTPQLLSCEGRSAGGLLIGAAINQSPELFRVAILGVPFVDVVSTMIDGSIPLTTGEWVEWGNPNEQKYHQYMMEYSPMNNVQNGKTYPSCWLTGGLHDPRVAFWEPAKFAAMLRNACPDGEGDGDSSNPICLKIDMSAGHFSASDRYKYLKELSCDYAFLLDQLGLVE
eukprot:CAMPEP_0198252270 /NCGR_PEP_ID=MMETSP1447-20131203/2793_1 /TAXON_ID=420782 /ORGANISM="Chaetoceros dichaeta, Strain CCMP1751" /LENGTH=773 /DNA_ID=CAMNT_0043937453 /DNA_START=215 /DNA_END=2536 /DNA_ORIENTATION=+